jgi:transposase InsO family protein
LVETQFSTKIKKFKSDNGSEYVNKDVSEFLAGKGTIHELSPPYAHESNGLPERINRTIVTMVRTMTLDVNDEFPVGLWAETALTAIYLKNLLPHAGSKNKKSPYE